MRAGGQDPGEVEVCSREKRMKVGTEYMCELEKERCYSKCKRVEVVKVD